jgi:hypothetical protein
MKSIPDEKQAEIRAKYKMPAKKSIWSPGLVLAGWKESLLFMVRKLTPRHILKIGFVSFFFFLTGCLSKERVYEGVYEGLKQREQIIHPSNEPVPQKLPSYDEYKREREKVLKENQ